MFLFPHAFGKWNFIHSFIAELQTRAMIYNQTRCPSTNKKEILYVYNRLY